MSSLVAVDIRLMFRSALRASSLVLIPLTLLTAWSGEHGGFVAEIALAVEAKGSLDSAGAFQVSKIERKL